MLLISGNTSINLKLYFMKTLKIKTIAGFVLFVFFAMSTFGQTPTKTTKENMKKPVQKENMNKTGLKESMKKPVKIEKGNVPKEVTEIFYMEYPQDMNDEYWYGYPAYDYDNYWYDNWYDPYVDTDSPEYYVVDFIMDNTPHKAVYSKAGKKFAVHKSVMDIPKPITEAISKGEYKSWTVGKEKEEIFKDKKTDKMKVYRVTVEKGKEKHNLFYQADGKLLKDKKVS